MKTSLTETAPGGLDASGWIARPCRRRACHGFTLTEASVAVFTVGMLVVALISGMNLVVRTVQLAQEELQATQVLVERLDTLRLYSWEKLTTPGFIPSSFRTALYPDSSTEERTIVEDSPSFHGTVAIAGSGLSETYGSDVRLVTVSLTWTNGGMSRTRSMSTYVARYGLQNFVH